MNRELNPNHIYRECEGRELFGYSTTVLKEKIKQGIIPAPKLLAPPPSRARGWFGHQILEYHKTIEAQQATWAADAKNYYVPEPPPRKKKVVKKAARRKAR